MPSQGSFTVGQAGSGADYATWFAALGAVSFPLTGDLTFTQIANTTDSSVAALGAGDFAGYTLTLTSDLNPQGSVSGGHVAGTTTSSYLFSFPSLSSTVVGAKLILEKLNIRRTVTTNGGGITATHPSSGVGITTIIRDVIVDLRTMTTAGTYYGIFIQLNTSGTLPQRGYIFNCTVLGARQNTLTSGGIWITAGGAAQGVIDDCWVEDVGSVANGCCFGTNATYYQVIFRNCVGIAAGTTVCFRNILSCNGVWSCMSTDATADDAAIGSGNVINITVTTEFVSGTPTDSTFMKPLSDRAKNDGTAVGSGYGNDHGVIETIARPHLSGALTKYSIGPREWPSTPVITVPPTTQTVNEGSSATFSLTATDVTGYQWEVKPSGGSWSSVPIGGTNPSYVTPATGGSDHLSLYRCQVSNDGGTVTSAEVYLLLSGWAVPWGGGAVAPSRPSVEFVDLVQKVLTLSVTPSVGTADVYRAEMYDSTGSLVAYAETEVAGELSITFPNYDEPYTVVVLAGNYGSPPVWSLPGFMVTYTLESPPAPEPSHEPVEVPEGEPIFSDLDPELRTDHQGNILILRDQEAINASLENIFSIEPGEMVMDPLFGSDLSRSVGKKVNDNSAAFIRMVISKTLDEEKRVLVQRLTVEPKPEDGEFLVVLEYTENISYIRGLFERAIRTE